MRVPQSQSHATCLDHHAWLIHGASHFLLPTPQHDPSDHVNMERFIRVIVTVESCTGMHTLSPPSISSAIRDEALLRPLSRSTHGFRSLLLPSLPTPYQMLPIPTKSIRKSMEKCGSGVS